MASTDTRLVAGRDMDVRRARLRQAEQDIELLTVKLERLLAEARTLKVVLLVVIPLAASILAGSFARLNGSVCALDQRLNALLVEKPVSAHELNVSLGELSKELTETRLALVRVETQLNQDTGSKPEKGKAAQGGTSDVGHKGG